MKKLLLLVLVNLILLNFSSCRKTANQTNNKLNFPLTDEIATLDPAIAYDTITAQVLYQAYETLYEYHYLKRPFTVTPLLAEDLPKIENDGKRYIIKIRPNITYHPDPCFKGAVRTVKAKDFINAIKRLAFTPINSSGSWLFEGKVVGINQFKEKAGDNIERFFSTQIEGVSAPDDHTLIIDLLQPYPQMIYALTLAFTSPIPKEAIDYYKNNFRTAIIGTGPYKLTNWNEQSSVELTKNMNYRISLYPSQGDRVSYEMNLLGDSNKPIPFIEKLHYEIVKEPSARWDSFFAGNLDIINIPKDHYKDVIDKNGLINKDLEKKGLALQIAPTLTFWWIAFNMRDPLIGKNRDLRLAIAHAIETEKYIRLFTNNVSQKSNSIYPPGVPGYDPTVTPPYSFNLEKAKEYLEKAGYPNGKGLPPIKYDVRGVDSTSREQAEFIKSELQQIGIRLDIVLNTFPEFIKKATTGDLVMWQDGWTLDYPDAENVISLLVSSNFPPGPNGSYYSNKKVDEVYEKIKVLPDGKEKFLYMREIENEIFNDIPWIIQYYSRNYILHRKDIKNYRPNDLINNTVKYYRLERN